MSFETTQTNQTNDSAHFTGMKRLFKASRANTLRKTNKAIAARALGRVGVRVGLTLASVLGIGAIAMQSTPATVQAAAEFHYQHGLYLDSGWLCRGWDNGVYHCTGRWHWSNGHPVSDNTAWVPNDNGSGGNGGHGGGNGHGSGNGGGGSGGGANTRGEPCRSTNYFGTNISQWATPSSCYAGIYYVNPRNYVYRPGFGWCNWWPEVLNPGRPNLLHGPYPRGYTPRPGATVVFAPGDQGASGAGHYAVVVAVARGGYWFLISEMNFYWRGGGFGRVSYRYVHVDRGVSFIY